MSRPDSSMLGTSAYERRENDFYATEPPATQAIANLMIAQGLLTPQSTVWESACGDGQMVEALRKTFPNVVATDIAPQMVASRLNFLTDEPDFNFDAIITNPPYNATDDWMKRCLHYVRERGVVAAMLMRHELDCASSRDIFFDKCPEFSARLTLTWRPRWIAGSKGSPRHNYAWYVWSAPDAPGRRASNFYAFRRDCRE